ncbi:3-oxoacyl-[acyl-carrier protein] reductase [Capronia epimyces CBS 606.96]|uniref:3-oxoacyl-[acyl-carrier protein] reductase n=1 Tax=Capronia epimyces CBS 606.96 TaxID=1182542 RepID=W9YJQ9_9EURO|nr:3-oxoacyl-[acyl-carrier protein] reductase [Capronia epimyces CBS 606.96]EXJ93142.1 3-oxoacyl-[acyl-carrier protein] reductase [Capronia epimyces CBS 606.96]
MSTLFPGVAVITGAAGTGIGAGVSKAFARAGCRRIAITDLNATLLKDTETAILTSYPDTQVLAVAGDVSDAEFVEKFTQLVVGTFGRIDYAVNCAGIMGNNQRSDETSIQDFDQINNVNYRGCWLCSRAQLKLMLQQEPLPAHDPERPPQRGSIVNIASQLALVGRPCAPAYSGSKAAVIAMTRADAIDYSADNIRINCICPGIIETPMTICDEERIRLLKPAVDIAPMRRMGKVDEVADCALFLCSTQASFVQGHAMVVDGGYIIN